MDKVTALAVLLLIAIPLVVLTLGIGWLMDDSFDTESDIEGQHNTVSDIHTHVHTRHGRGRGNNKNNRRMGGK